VFSDALRQAFEELVRLRVHDVRHRLGHRAVVHGVGEIVRCASRAEIDREFQVDAKRLRAFPFLRKHTVHSGDEQVLHDDHAHAPDRKRLSGGSSHTRARHLPHGPRLEVVQRSTKIVATLGPATSDPQVLKNLLAAGVDVVRLNAAHGTAALHEENAAAAREAAEAVGRVVGVLVDLPGPKLRTGPIEGDWVPLEPGETLTLSAESVMGTKDRVSTTIDGLASLVHPGGEVFLADGEIVLKVAEIDNEDVVCTVVRGGVLRSRKGMYVPGAEHHVAAFTEADRVAFDMSLRIRADFIGLSFVRDAKDVQRVRDMLPKRGHKPALVSKIETRASLAHLEAIAELSDAIMVARGDLGIQVDIARVPLIQKNLIDIANRTGTPVITATQVLLSMTKAPIPTRAEVTDVANAVLDGTDALMLSEETAVGEYPVETIETMARVAMSAESWPRQRLHPAEIAVGEDPVSWAVAHAAVEAADDLKAAAIVCPTRSGATPRRVATFRPNVPIIGLSDHPEVLSRLALSRGVYPSRIRSVSPGDEEIEVCVEAALRFGFVNEGDLVVIASASAGRRAGSTDSMRVVRV